jgi:hypothetical protein
MFSVLENTSGLKSLFYRGALCESWVLSEIASSMSYTYNDARLVLVKWKSAFQSQHITRTDLLLHKQKTNM